jgi:hypothetical protein
MLPSASFPPTHDLLACTNTNQVSKRLCGHPCFIINHQKKGVSIKSTCHVPFSILLLLDHEENKNSGGVKMSIMPEHKNDGCLNTTLLLVEEELMCLVVNPISP